MDLSKDTIFLKIKNITGKILNFNERNIKRDSKIIEDLGAGLFDLPALYMELEDEFKHEFSNEDVLTLKTIEDVENLILQKNMNFF